MDESQPKPDLDVPLDSVAIRRLIEEIRAEKENDQPLRLYNRVYSRHNRS